MSMRRYALVIAAIIIAAMMVVSCTPPPYNGDNPELYTAAIRNVTGYATMGAATNVIETDEYGRVLFEYSMPTGFYHDGEDRKIHAYVISQKADSENVYYYDGICFETVKKRSDFDDKMEAALKERNDWNKPINEDKLTCRRILKRVEKKFDYYETRAPINISASREPINEILRSHVDVGEYESIASELFDKDSFGRGLYFSRCFYREKGQSRTYGSSYFMMIEPDGTYDESSFIIEVDAYNYWEDLMEFKELHNWNEP